MFDSMSTVWIAQRSFGGSRVNQLVRLVALLLACAVSTTRSFPVVPRPLFGSQQDAVASMDQGTEVLSADKRHVVEGIVCREIPLDLPVVGTIRVLEATAESQNDLVEMALEVDGDYHEELSTRQLKLNAGDPYGAVLWPAAWAVANYVLTEVVNERGSKQQPLKGLRICELGTGTGLVSIACAMAGAEVIATDYEPLALELAAYAARELNIGDSLEPNFSTRLLDMCKSERDPLPPVDLVVAADIMYEKHTGRAMARRACEALRQGSRVIVGDSPGRAGRPAFLEELQKLGVTGACFHDKVGRTCTGPRNELICGTGSQSVSEKPTELPVAIMDLEPTGCHLS